MSLARVEPEWCSLPAPATSTPGVVLPDARLYKGACVTAHGLVKSPDLNGRSATIIGFVPDSQRCRLQFSGGFIGSLKRDNFIFPALCDKCGTEITTNRCFCMGEGASNSDVSDSVFT